MSKAQVEEIQVLKLSLHQRLVGYLAGFTGGRNVLSFAEEFKNDAGRPTLSLITPAAYRAYAAYRSGSG